ncbi:MAG: SirB1 family protein [Candidatus Tectimicrobiota bacterium]
MSTLTDRELSALLRLLSDPSAATRAVVEASLASLDPVALDQVRAARDRLSPEAARRIEELTFLVPRRGFLGDLTVLVEAGGDELDLEAGIWCLARFRDPDLVTAPYTRELERLSEAVRSRIGQLEPSPTVLETFVQVLFDEEGFHGNLLDYYDPDNSFFHKVLERRRGIPITLSVLCLLVGRRAGLPLEGIGLPGHFLCRFGPEEEDLFFDPFHDGRRLTRQGCADLCRQGGVAFKAAYLRPSTNREILQRMVRNLREIYLQREALLEVGVLEDYLAVLDSEEEEEEDEAEGAEEWPDEEAPDEAW